MSSPKKKGAPRAVADLGTGTILASVEIEAPAERVFEALTSAADIVQWWGSDDLYRTTAHHADLRVGGKWRSDGQGNDGHAFSVGGEFLEVDPPRRLVQTWEPSWNPGLRTRVSYQLDATTSGTRLTVRHEGFSGNADSCRDHESGWERVLDWFAAYLRPAAPPPPLQGDGWTYYVLKLLPPRASFMFDMTADERAMMMDHAQYWQTLMTKGNVVVFGPVADPSQPYGIGIIRARSEQELSALTSADPAVTAGRGLRHEIAPMVRAVLPS